MTPQQRLRALNKIEPSEWRESEMADYIRSNRPCQKMDDNGIMEYLMCAEIISIRSEYPPGTDILEVIDAAMAEEEGK